MGKTTGFMEFERKDETYAPVKNRIKNYKEFTQPLKEKELKNKLKTDEYYRIITFSLNVISKINFLFQNKFLFLENCSKPFKSKSLEVFNLGVWANNCVLV